MTIVVTTGAFTAKYRGHCALPTCERGGDIEQGDAVQYTDDELMHLSCSRRVMRGQTEKLCTTCYLYHAGECNE